MKLSNYAKYVWAVLGVNLIVILWGAYVRATGSGAGCGSHWPLCNGAIIPRAPQIETIVEYFHRVSSGIALIAVLGMLIWAFRLYPKGHEVRIGAVLSSIFIITEALVGAGLVLFEWVAKDESIGRVFSMAVHLVNTFLLLASITLTGWWASGGKPIRLQGRRGISWMLVIGLFGMILLGISGAITALGDTLFPATTLSAGLRQDLSTTAHIAIRLRIWHPILAILVGSYLFIISGILGWDAHDRLQSLTTEGAENTHSEKISQAKATRFLAAMLIFMVLCQLSAGLVNILLLAPVWMQLVHLFLADMVWILLVLLSASVLVDNRPKTVVVEQRDSNLHVVIPGARI